MERMGGKKRREGKKRGKGWWGCKTAGVFKIQFSNVQHCATLEIAIFYFLFFCFFFLKKKKSICGNPNPR
jgi:hypothetical protein